MITSPVSPAIRLSLQYSHGRAIILCLFRPRRLCLTTCDRYPNGLRLLFRQILQTGGHAFAVLSLNAARTTLHAEDILAAGRLRERGRTWATAINVIAIRREAVRLKGPVAFSREIKKTFPALSKRTFAGRESRESCPFVFYLAVRHADDAPIRQPAGRCFEEFQEPDY